MSAGTVWILKGWFGDIEWIEGVYATEELAQAEADRLWMTRRSVHAPEWCQGLCKFAAEPYEVISANHSDAGRTLAQSKNRKG